jgi:glycosyltransferase involved in cell wall biosynthesis
MKLSFFGPVKNDWVHASSMLKSIDKVLRVSSKEIILVDDASSETEVEYARSLQKEHGDLSIIFNTKHQGIVPCLNQAIERLSGNIAIPISADMELTSKVLPGALFYAFQLCQVDFFFAKARHIDPNSKETVGITGWSVTKGVQRRQKSIENFISGQTRPSGSAVAIRTELLKQYRYDKTLASLSDFYLNNLMILKHKSFYYGKVVSKTLERKASYSNSFNQEQSLALVEKTVTKYESDGVILTDAQKSRYREYEKSQWAT